MIRNFAKIDPNIPISAIGKIGNDENGEYVVAQLQKYGIDTSQISVSAKASTSFCNVMNMPTGERTFFHARSSNA